MIESLVGWMGQVQEVVPRILAFLGTMVGVYLLMGVARTIILGVAGDDDD